MFSSFGLQFVRHVMYIPHIKHYVRSNKSPKSEHPVEHQLVSYRISHIGALPRPTIRLDKTQATPKYRKRLPVELVVRIQSLPNWNAAAFADILAESDIGGSTTVCMCSTWHQPNWLRACGGRYISSIISVLSHHAAALNARSLSLCASRADRQSFERDQRRLTKSKMFDQRTIDVKDENFKLRADTRCQSHILRPASERVRTNPMPCYHHLSIMVLIDVGLAYGILNLTFVCQ